VDIYSGGTPLAIELLPVRGRVRCRTLHKQESNISFTIKTLRVLKEVWGKKGGKRERKKSFGPTDTFVKGSGGRNQREDALGRFRTREKNTLKKKKE